jgi:hypothetical protein
MMRGSCLCGAVSFEFEGTLIIRLKLVTAHNVESKQVTFL